MSVWLMDYLAVIGHHRSSSPLIMVLGCDTYQSTNTGPFSFIDIGIIQKEGIHMPIIIDSFCD